MTRLPCEQPLAGRNTTGAIRNLNGVKEKVMSMNEEQVKSYIANAAANFSTPDEVVDHTELSVAQKRKILQWWRAQ